jgi:hypothetical protein
MLVVRVIVTSARTTASETETRRIVANRLARLILPVSHE